MYLSKIDLNTKKRNTLFAFFNPQRFHGAIEQSFSSAERKRNLWRIDKNGKDYCILLLSEYIPDLSNFVEQFGYDRSENAFVTKDYTNFINNIREGSFWRFRLTANPVVCRHEGNKIENKKFYSPCIGNASQAGWIIDKAPQNGFSVDQDSLMISGSKKYTFCKNGDKNKKVTLSSVTYDGVLQVGNKDLMQRALISGIGKGKAYGMGLLTLVRNH